MAVEEDDCERLQFSFKKAETEHEARKSTDKAVILCEEVVGDKLRRVKRSLLYKNLYFIL